MKLISETRVTELFYCVSHRAVLTCIAM